MEVNGKEQKLYELENVEIFKVGRWKGDNYTKEDLDEMIRAFEEVGNLVKPYIKLGHDEDQKLLQKDGYPAAGWITGLKRKGDSLLAKFSGLPEKIYFLIKNKAYGRMSSEIFNKVIFGGKKYSKVVRAVALLGANTPAVETLDDFINLYTENLEYEIYTTDDYENIKSENNIKEKVMDKEMNVEKYTNQIFELQSELKKFTDEKKELESMIEKFTKENEDLKKFISDKEKENHEKEVEFFINDSLEKGKILPSQKEFLVKLSRDKEGFEQAKSFIENQPKIVEFSKEKSEYKEIDKSKKSDDTMLDEKIKKYAKENNVSYMEAFDMISYEEVQ